MKGQCLIVNTRIKSRIESTVKDFVLKSGITYEQSGIFRIYSTTNSGNGEFERHFDAIEKKINTTVNLRIDILNAMISILDENRENYKNLSLEIRTSIIELLQKLQIDRDKIDKLNTPGNSIESLIKFKNDLEALYEEIEGINDEQKNKDKLILISKINTLNKYIAIISKSKNLRDYIQSTDLFKKYVDLLSRIESGVHDLEHVESENTTNEENKPERKIEKKVKDALQQIFLTTPSPMALCRSIFRDAVFEMTVITDLLIVKDNESLNIAICNKKNQFYKTLLKYLKSKFPDEDFVEEMFKEDGDLNDTSYIFSYMKAIRKFQELLPVTNPLNFKNGKVDPNNEDIIKMQMLIRRGYADYLSKKTYTEDYNFFMALNAYISLYYFDDLLLDCTNIINIDPYIGKNVEVSRKYDKYTYNRRPNELAKGWNTVEHEDALKTSGRFSKVIIEHIKYVDYRTKKEQAFNLNTTLFTAAITNLFGAAIKAKSLGLSSSEEGNIEKDVLQFLVNLHEDVSGTLQGIFESLFEKGKGGYSTLISDLKEKGGLTDYDLNVLYSIYLFLFKGKPEQLSLIDIEYNTFYGSDKNESFTQGEYPISECLFGFVDRLMQANYLETYIDQTGYTQVRVKKKFSTRKREMDIRNKLNESIITICSNPDLSERIQELYNFHRQGNGFRFTINLGGEEGEVQFEIVPNSESNNIFEANDNVVTLKRVEVDEFGRETLVSIANGQSLTLTSRNIDNLDRQNPLLAKMLEFIGDVFGLNFKNKENLERLLIAQTIDSNIIIHMFKSAARFGCINNLYYESRELNSDSPFLYIIQLFPELTPTDNKPKNNIWNRTTDQDNPNLKGIRFYDTWIDAFAQADAIIDGSSVKSTTKNTFGDNIGNFSTAFLGGNIMYYLNQALRRFNATSGKFEERPNSVLANLLFSKNMGLIEGIAINLDANSRGTKKLVKKMNTSELLYQSIFSNFYGSYFGASSNGSIIIQPTTYSDKTKIIQYIINARRAVGSSASGLENGDIGASLFDLNTEELIEVFINTIGSFYTEAFKNTLEKYIKIFNIGINRFSQEILNKYIAIKLLNPDKTELDFILNDIDKTEVLKLVILEINNINNDSDITNKLDYITRLAQETNVELYTHSDYRVEKNGNIRFNELLDYYANYLFTNKDNLRNRLKEESIKFVNDMIKSNLIFYLSYSDGSDTVVMLTIEKLFPSTGYNPEEHKNPLFGSLNLNKGDNIRLAYLRKWTDHGKLILARSGSKIYTYGDLIPVNDPNVEINPLIEKYFYTDTLLSNNLRLSLTGTELAHPSKKYFSEVDITSSFEDRQKYFLDNKSSFERIESEVQMVQLKRNVIIPATLQYMTQHTLRGIPSINNIAIINDPSGRVFNYSGENKGQDGNDGAGRCNSLISILENNSLQDQRVGTVKKTIMHAPIYGTGGVFLGKWAIFPTTNKRMNGCIGNKSDDYELNKAMLNLQWYEIKEDGHIEFNRLIDRSRMARYKKNKDGELVYAGEIEIDLTSVRGQAGPRLLDFERDILKGRSLYRRRSVIGGSYGYYQIFNFGKNDDGIYYTVENRIGTDLLPTLHSDNIYHLFNLLSEHIELTDRDLKDIKLENIGHGYFRVVSVPSKFEAFKVGEIIHTVNSNFELLETMGGLDSVELDDYNNFVVSESSNYATVEFINALSYINERKSVRNTRRLNSNMYYQPLKDCMIHYVVNSTAVKNGAGNINEAYAWERPEGLKYIRVQYDGIGVQLDTDHDVTESLLTEFSLVIASLDALGNTHEIARNIYNSLRQISLLSSNSELSAFRQFLSLTFDRSNAKERFVSDLYDIVARVIVESYKNNNEGNLADEILSKIKAYFNDNIDHLLDEFKIPFSDPGIFKSILPTFVGEINAKAIKRKYPGSGMVQCPSFNFVLIYDIGGYTYQFSDLYEELLGNKELMRLAPYRKYKYESERHYKRRVVEYYLEEKLQEVIAEADASGKNTRNCFHPTENVLVRVQKKDAEGKLMFKEDGTADIAEFEISLDDINDYTTFTEDYWYILISDYENYDYANAKFYHNVRRPRNLAPAKTTWEEEISDGVWVMRNAFMEESVRKGFTTEVKYEVTTTIGDVETTVSKTIIVPTGSNIEDILQKIHKNSIINIIETNKRKSKNSEILEMFRQVKAGVILRTTASGEIVLHRIRNVQDKESEIIMSSLYSKIFPDHHNLAKVLKDRSLLNITPIINITGLRDYHITLGKHNGRHSFITFNKVNADEEITRTSSYTQIKSREYTSKGKTFLLIYTLDKNSLYAYPIGYLELVEGLRFNEETRQIEKDGEVFIDEENKYRIGKNNEVYMEHIFVKKYNVTQMTPTKKKELLKPSTHRLYEIDYEAIKEFFGTEDNIYLNIINEILSYLYESELAEDLRVSLDSRFWDKSSIDKATLAEIIGRTEFLDTVIELTKYNITGLLQEAKPLYLLNQLDNDRIVSLKQYLDSLNLEELQSLSEDQKNVIKNKIREFLRIYDISLKKFIYLKGKFSEDLLDKLFSKVTTNNTFLKHKDNILREFRDLLMNEKLITQIFGHYGVKNTQVLTSFERSLEMICSRIPALSLLSFMKCKVAGFIPGTDNYVYISHWLLYLQGSDYDIDKSYIMGSAIDRNGTYIAWSPLFEYSTLETLKASEELPFPTLDKIEIDEDDGLDITQELIEFATSEKRSVKRIKSYVHALTKIINSDKTTIKIDKSNPEIIRIFGQDLQKASAEILAETDPKELRKKLISFYKDKFNKKIRSSIILTEEELKKTEEELDKIIKDKIQKKCEEMADATILDKSNLDRDIAELSAYRLNKRLKEFANLLTKHNKYRPSDEILELAIKNNISSKIGIVVEDLINRVHSYTPVDMKDIRPEENTSNPMSLLNSATKFIMQVLNMVGKDVIGITAVGMKIFYNLTYYFNEEIRQGRTKHLMFSRTFNRIQNRYNESRDPELLKKIKEIRRESNNLIHSRVLELITDDDLYQNSSEYLRLLNDAEIIEYELSRTKQTKSSEDTSDKAPEDTSRRTIFEKGEEIKEKLDKKELTEDLIELANEFLDLLKTYKNIVDRNKEYDKNLRKIEKESGKTAILSDKTEQKNTLRQLHNLYARITKINLSTEKDKKVTLGDKISLLTELAILNILSEEQKLRLEVIRAEYLKLRDGAVNRKIKFISKNIRKLATKVIKDLEKSRSDSEIEEIIKDKIEEIKRKLYNRQEITYLERELYYAFIINEINTNVNEEINNLRKKYSGLRSRTIDKLANINFASDNVLQLADSFEHIKNISKEIREKNPGITNEELTKQICKILNQELDDAEKADIFISELLSAATDNAKELILALINAGSDLAGYYLYLLSLGFNIKDIVAFMTSPVILSLHDLTQVNMFNDLIPLLTIDNIIDILRGNLYSLNLNDRLSKAFHNRIGYKEEEFLNYVEARIDGSETEPVTSFLYGAQGDFLENVILTIKRNLNDLVFSDYLLDLKELIYLAPLVKEHSSLGNVLLGTNQGLPTSEEELLSKLGSIHRIVRNREKEFGISKYFISSINEELEKNNSDIKIEQLRLEISLLKVSENTDIFDITENLTEELEILKLKIEKIKDTDTFQEMVKKLMDNNPKLEKEYIENELLRALLVLHNGKPIALGFDVREWIMNPNYLKKIRNYYNIIKGTWNVFDVIYRLPHYRGIFELFRLTYGVNHEMSLKARLIDRIHLELLDEDIFLDDYSLELIEEYVDDKLIYKFITTKLLDWTVPIPSEAGVLNPERLIEYFPDTKYVRLENVLGIANFKRFMETHIIPKLKNGSLTKVVLLPDGTFVDTGELIITGENLFIERLQQYTNEAEVTAYKIDGIDMMNIDSSDNTRYKYLKVVDDFTKLHRILYGGHSLADWFMLYNLIINKNKYGSDRMTSIFRSFIQGVSGENLYKIYYKFIGHIDYNYKSEESMDLFDIDRLDIDLYLAKLVPEYLEKSCKDKYIKLIKNGRLIYKRRTKKGEYIELPFGIDKTLYQAMGNTEDARRYRNSKQYYPRPNPNYENKEYFKTLLGSQNVFDIFKGLVMLEANSVVKINIVC